MTKNLLCISNSFYPEVTPTAIRCRKILENLENWKIQVITEATESNFNENIDIFSIKSWYPAKIIDYLCKCKLEKIVDWFIYPDKTIFWLLPALFKAKALIKQQKPDVIVVFMMPYGTGLLGILLKWLTQLPLVLNFDDSPTCSDMHPSYSSWIHYRITRWLEDFYISCADAIIYVSHHNLDRVKSRQPKELHSKFHLVRYGADLKNFKKQSIYNITLGEQFLITYIGGMNGWHDFYHLASEKTLFKKIYRLWMQLGRYKLTELDYRSSSPVFVGQAIKQLLCQHPNWENKIQFHVYGNTFPKSVVQKVLTNEKIADIVKVFDSLPNDQATKIACQADILLITLPERLDGSCGGRISAKTYEYLATDRSILAAVPKGESWDYLSDKPGVWLTEPTNVSAIAKVIEHVALAKLSHQDMSFDRSYLHNQISYINLAKEFDQILQKLCKEE